MNTAQDHPKDTLSAEELLAERNRLEALYRDKYTREISVMFTDLKGSTELTEKHGDLATRELVSTHNSLLYPIINQNSGVLVKTMGDGTMSYFESSIEAIRTAIAFQKAITERNQHSANQLPLEVRIGIHTGVGIVEENDIYGDVVNVASRYESLADAGEIYISDTSWEAIEDKDEFYIRFFKEAHIKGKQDNVQIYKVFWNEDEIKQDLDKEHPAPSSHTKAAKSSSITPSGIARLVLAALLMVGSVFVLMSLMDQNFTDNTINDTRSKQDIAVPARQP